MNSFISTIREGNNALIARIAAIAALGGMLFGYDTGVISGALLYIKKDFSATTFEQEMIVSSLLVGAMVGAMSSGWLADHISRRRTKIISGSLYMIGALGAALAVNVPMLTGFRFLLGLSVGTASFVSPMYIAELAPPRIRGGLTSFNQLAITVGIAVSYLVNFAFSSFTYDWRWMLGVAAIPGAALVVGMLTVPSSPRWLVEQGQGRKAHAVLRRLRRGDPYADVDGELADIQKVNEAMATARVRQLFRPGMRSLVMLGVGLAIAQQFVGVNTVIYYAPTILSATGLNAGGAIGQTVFVGLTNVAFTIIAVLLLDRVGRRGLLIVGTSGLLLGLLTLGTYFLLPTLQQQVPWLALAALLVYIASFAVGLGPVFWLMISEIYPLRLRGMAMAVSTVANWGANFIVSVSFLSLVDAISRAGTFYLYAGLAFVALVLFWWKVPETKARSLEQIERDLTGTAAAPGA